jgi:hypothetical protein
MCKQGEGWVPKARQWDNSLPAISQTLEVLNKAYEAKNLKRILKVLGHNSNISWDPADLYQAQHRLKEAEVAFRSEVQGRIESMGILSSSLLSLLGTLALILAARKGLPVAGLFTANRLKAQFRSLEKTVTKHC